MLASMIFRKSVEEDELSSVPIGPISDSLLRTLELLEDEVLVIDAEPETIDQAPVPFAGVFAAIVNAEVLQRL